MHRSTGLTIPPSVRLELYCQANLVSYFIQAIKDAGLDVNGFLTVGVSAALRQLLEFGLFHGDPHPGNIFAMRDGRIAYVDFGNVAQLSQVHIVHHNCRLIVIEDCHR